MISINDLISNVLFYPPLLLSVIFFIVSLVLFLKTPKESPKRKKYKVMFIVSLVLMSVVIALYIAAIIMLAVTFISAIMYM